MEIEFGALAAPLSRQTGLPPQDVDLEQRMADAITLLGVHEMISEVEKRRARKRLLRRLARILQAKGRATKP